MSQVHTIQSADGVIVRDPNNGIMSAKGTTVPTDGTAGYSKGCIFTDIDASAGSQLFVNEGSNTSCDFNALVSGDSAQTVTGSRTFSGSVKFTGTSIDNPVSVITTSQITLSASAHAGKTIVFTSAAGSRHKRVVLPFASTLTGGGSGMQVRFISDIATLSSNGITIVTSAATGRLLNGNSRPLKSTSRIGRGGGCTLMVANNKWFIAAREYGRGMSLAALKTSLAWINV